MTPQQARTIANKLTAACPLVLLSIYVLVWIALALAPLDRSDWMLENVLPLITLPLLIFTYRWQRFTNRAYILLFVFMVLHAIGAHYTYAKVPYDAWLQALTGHRLNDLLGLQRNHFDRLIHFLYGALLFRVFFELFAPHIDGRGWRYFLVCGFLMAHAGIYEVIEWGAAAAFGGDLGVAYLGTQGDEWDAQKDMALAMVGTLLAMVIHLLGARGKTSNQPGLSTPPH